MKWTYDCVGLSFLKARPFPFFTGPFCAAVSSSKLGILGTCLFYTVLDSIQSSFVYIDLCFSWNDFDDVFSVQVSLYKWCDFFQYIKFILKSFFVNKRIKATIHRRLHKLCS